MKLLKLRFLLLGVALFVPIWLLVDRALESVEFERQARHDAVAERVFDEIERELSALLQREETRPFSDYSSSPGSPSPLAPLPVDDWLVGYFQINPDGSFQTPHQPAPASTASTARPDLDEKISTLERTAGILARDPQGGKKSGALAKERQLAGTTEKLGPKRALKAPQEAQPKSKELSAYDALSSLNRGVRQREKRRGRAPGRFEAEEVEANEADALGGEAKLDAARAYARRDGRDEPALPMAAAVTEDRAFAVDDIQRGLAIEPEAGAFLAGRAVAPLARLNQAAQQSLGIALTPMTGSVLDAQHLLLFRTVLRQSRGYRQGLVIDVPHFSRWLGHRAVGSSGLDGRAELRFGTVFAPPPEIPATSHYAYRRRFADPFADLNATLELQGLQGFGGGSYVLALSALLVLVGALGLLAMYRMVAVALRFAERRSNFAAAVSHELKTPLTAIRMYAEMLRDGMVDSDEKRHEYYEAMTNESERLSRLIHNVLEFSQLEKGRRELASEVGPLEPVVRETERLLRTHVEREGFSLEVDVEPGLPSVRFDRDALLQVLFNLVDNALKYAVQADDKRISLRCERDAGGVRICVRDHGPGVAAQKLSKVFEPFYRVEAELTRRTKGTGIGLALVQGLVLAMDGQVSAENVEPSGLRISIRFAAA